MKTMMVVLDDMGQAPDQIADAASLANHPGQRPAS